MMSDKKNNIKKFDKGLLARSRLLRRQRIMMMVIGAIILSSAIGLMLFSFRDNVIFFYGPLDVQSGKVDKAVQFRIGGLVKEGSVQKKTGDEATVLFSITDGVADVAVEFSDLLPALFREGQGVVALGRLQDNEGGDGLVFKASEVLAKHDENYMPKEAMEAMKRAGTWQGE